MIPPKGSILQSSAFAGNDIDMAVQYKSWSCRILTFDPGNDIESIGTGFDDLILDTDLGQKRGDIFGNCLFVSFTIAEVDAGNPNQLLTYPHRLSFKVGQLFLSECVLRHG